MFTDGSEELKYKQQIKNCYKLFLLIFQSAVHHENYLVEFAPAGSIETFG